MSESGRRVEPVAIVGIGCRLPGGANDPESFWSLLVESRSGISQVPADRWNLDRFYHPDPAAAGGMVMQRGGFVDHLADFDAGFWGISPREAVRMDPQQRWLLEVAWEAIEDAGVAPSQLRGRRIGVFVGISGNDYGGLQLRSTEDVDAYTNSGSTASIASNRISYLLDLKGPSVSLDTACSSSLVAVSAACESIWSGQSAGALAGGVNALISPQTSVGFSKASMISPTGQCFAFDARANGFVRAEGAALVYLKPLSAALADGDRIYAVVRGAAVNQDGHTSSMTVPSVDGQAAMLEDAYPTAVSCPRASSTSRRTAPERRWAIQSKRRPSAGFSAAARTNPLSDRIGEDEHRASGVGFRNRRADQGRSRAAPPDHSGDTQSRDIRIRPFRFTTFVWKS